MARLTHPLTLLLLVQLWSTTVLGAANPGGAPLDDRAQVADELKRAAQLYRDKNYRQAAAAYKYLSGAAQPDQAAWALELYGVCLERQRQHGPAIIVYNDWLARYPGSEGEARVQQRLLALETARAQPKVARQESAEKASDTRIFGSSSLVYRGLQREIDGQDSETAISALSADADLHISSRTGSLSWRGRATGGYIDDASDDGESDGRVSNLYMEVLHEPTGAELALGRQRTNDLGVYGYFDGARLRWPVLGNLGVTVMGGSVSTSSWKSSDSDRQVYGLGFDMELPDRDLHLEVYGIEQSYDGVTERRALGGEISWFSDLGYALFIADYDIEFEEANNLMFNGAWDVLETTNVAVSLGYQRSPFLNASNAVIGEFGLDLKQVIEGLAEGIDIYDAALDKTALNRYGSVVVNQKVNEKLRLVGEVYHYELSDLPDWGNPQNADSDASNTFGARFVRSDAFMQDDFLSFGLRYTDSDTMKTASVFVDEKLHLGGKGSLVLRLRASQRSMDQTDQDTWTVQPGMRLDWYFTRNLLLELELGYEYMLQDFRDDDVEMQQGYAILGLRSRF